MADDGSVSTSGAAPANLPKRRAFKLSPPKVSDAVAGLVAALFSVPEGMAYAAIGGFSPTLGLYAGIAPTMIAALTTGTVLMISTLTSAIALSSASVLEAAGLEPTNTTAVITLTFLVGVLMTLLGVFRLGNLISFISNAVMTGFVVGVALSIITGAFHDFSGFKPVGANTVAKTVDWITHINEWVPAAVAVGTLTVVLSLLFKRSERTEKIGTILVLFIVTLVVFVFKIPVELVKDVSTIPSSLPSLTLPDPSLMPTLILGAVSVSLVALAQGAGISAAVPNPDGSRASASRDFLGQGLGNLAGGLFQALPSGGSLSRTGVSTGAGSRTRWAGVFAGMFLALVLLFFGGLAGLIPEPLIGGLLFVIGGELIAGKFHDVVLVLRSSFASAAAMLITFLATLFIPLQWAILLGAALSLILYLQQAAAGTRLNALVRNSQGQWEIHEPPTALPSNQATVLQYETRGFFAEIPRIEALLPDREGTTNAAVLLIGRGVHDMSSAYLKLLGHYNRDLRASGNILMLVSVEPEVMAILEREGLVAAIGKENIFPAQPVIGGALEAAYSAAQEWLARGATDPQTPETQPEQPPAPPAAPGSASETR